MKRVAILTLSIFLLGGFYLQVSGHTFNKAGIISQQSQKNKKVKIKSNDLPAGVKDVLKKEYQGWALTTNLYQVRRPNGNSYYEVELQKDLQTMIFNIDENGNKLSEVNLGKREEW